jgi:hypothetical protein
MIKHATCQYSHIVQLPYLAHMSQLSGFSFIPFLARLPSPTNRSRVQFFLHRLKTTVPQKPLQDQPHAAIKNKSNQKKSNSASLAQRRILRRQ